MPTRHVVLAHGIFRFDMVRILFRDHAGIDIGVPALVAADGREKAIEQLSFPIPADHLNEVGLWDPGELFGGLTTPTFERRVKDFYLHLAQSA